jgi:hypothetical protein
MGDRIASVGATATEALAEPKTSLFSPAGDRSGGAGNRRTMDEVGRRRGFWQALGVEGDDGAVGSGRSETRFEGEKVGVEGEAMVSLLLRIRRGDVVIGSRATFGDDNEDSIEYCDEDVKDPKESSDSSDEDEDEEATDEIVAQDGRWCMVGRVGEYVDPADVFARGRAAIGVQG